MAGWWLFPPPVFAGKIYRWVDEQGKVQFGDRPIAKDSEEVKVRVDAPREGEARQDLRDRIKKMRDENAKENTQKKEQQDEEKVQASQRKQQCKEAQDRLKRYEETRRLSQVDEQGNRIMLNHGERAKKIDEARSAVSAACG